MVVIAQEHPGRVATDSAARTRCFAPKVFRRSACTTNLVAPDAPRTRSSSATGKTERFVQSALRERAHRRICPSVVGRDGVQAGCPPDCARHRRSAASTACRPGLDVLHHHASSRRVASGTSSSRAGLRGSIALRQPQERGHEACRHVRPPPAGRSSCAGTKRPRWMLAYPPWR